MGKSFVSTFLYDCELHFNDKDGKSTDIIKETVKYILISHDYKNKIMPVIYLKVNLTPSLYNKMVHQQGVGKIVLTLSRIRDSGSTSSIAKHVVNGEFDYYMTDDPNAYKALDEVAEANGNIAYKTCTIGLIKSDIISKNQRSFEGVYKNTNTLSLIQSATSNMNIIIQPFTNNTDIETFTCPAVTSVGQFINYVNSKYSFYSGNYIYYIDFDKTYLRSNDGSYIDMKDNDFRYIAFDVEDLTQYQSLSSGMVEDEAQNAYIIYVNANDAQVNTDRVTSDLNGIITSVDTSQGGEATDVSIIDTSAITNITGTTNAAVIINSTDPNAANNAATIVSENANTLTITKADMNSKVFTPNKQYMLSYYHDNPSYCGLYYLVEKTEMYLLTGTNLKCQMTITLKKCADFISSIQAKVNARSSKVASAETTTGTVTGDISVSTDVSKGITSDSTGITSNTDTNNT